MPKLSASDEALLNYLEALLHRDPDAERAQRQAAADAEWERMCEEYRKNPLPFQYSNASTYRRRRRRRRPAEATPPGDPNPPTQTDGG